MLPHTVPCFKILATLFTMNISIFQVFSLYMPPNVSLPFHNSTSHTSPQATTLVHHLRLSQLVQEVACGNKCVVIYFIISSRGIYSIYLKIQDLLVWLYRDFLELNSLLQLGQEYTKRFGKWIASIWFFTHVIVLLENLKQIPHVGIFSSFLIKNFSKSSGPLISPEEAKLF